MSSGAGVVAVGGVAPHQLPILTHRWAAVTVPSKNRITPKKKITPKATPTHLATTSITKPC